MTEPDPAFVRAQLIDLLEDAYGGIDCEVDQRHAEAAERIIAAFGGTAHWRTRLPGITRTPPRRA